MGRRADRPQPVYRLTSSLQSGKTEAKKISSTPLTAADKFLHGGSAVVAYSRPSIEVAMTTAFHPHANELSRRLEKIGIDGLLSTDTQALGNGRPAARPA